LIEDLRKKFNGQRQMSGVEYLVCGKADTLLLANLSTLYAIEVESFAWACRGKNTGASAVHAAASASWDGILDTYQGASANQSQREKGGGEQLAHGRTPKRWGF
jgi:hypothetical protein